MAPTRTALIAAALLLARPAAVAAAPAGLYGLSEQQQLLYICDNGTSVAVGQPLPQFLEAQGLTTIDLKKGIFYAIFYVQATSAPALVGLSLEDGSVVSTTPLPFTELGFVGVGQFLAFNGATGQAIVGGQDGAQVHHFGTITPGGNDYKEFSSMNTSYIDVLGGCSAVYVPATDSVVVQLGFNPPSGVEINLYSISLATGAINTLLEQGDANIETLADYDNVTGHVFGLGISVAGSTLQRLIVDFDPVNMTITTVGKVSVDTIESGGISAFNSKARSVYWIGDVSGNDEFYLIQNAVSSGAQVLSHGALCPDDAVCPWSLEYWPGSA